MDGGNLFSQWAHLLLVWVGFGTLVGLLAKAIFPGRDPGGALATVIIGILGSIIGAGVLVFFSENLRVTPISLIGFVVAILGTSLLLLVYRLLNAGGYRMSWPFGRRRGRRRIAVVEEK
jgi:uncharacterized membrane protein YeaQ/YmgE (transglycosylase-associated protein family)